MNPNDRYSGQNDMLGIAGLDEERIAQFIIEQIRNVNWQRPGTTSRDNPDIEIRSNADFWSYLANEYGSPSYFRWAKLVNFKIIDWFPRTPGLYHTDRAGYARREAQQYSREEKGIRFYEPMGKTHMIDGGIGSIRFKPILIEGSECWLCTATSDGYCHSGIPLAIPSQIMSKIEFNYKYIIYGQTRFLPNFLERHFYHMTRIPQIYLLVDSIEKVGFSHVPVHVTPMVFFTGEKRQRYSEQGNVTYVTCRADSLLEIDRAAEWLHDYTERYNGEIITNFDEQRPTFKNAPFSLQNVMAGNLKAEQLSRFNIERAEIVCNTVHEIHSEVTKMTNKINIGDNATVYGDVVAATSIRNSFNKVEKSEIPDKLKESLKKLSLAVEKMSEKLPKDSAQQVARDLETLVAEATSPAPRKEWWNLSIEGLKKAAKDVGEIGKPVLELAGTIVAILMGKP
jgi:hypothetical protein